MCVCAFKPTNIHARYKQTDMMAAPFCFKPGVVDDPIDGTEFPRNVVALDDAGLSVFDDVRASKPTGARACRCGCLAGFAVIVAASAVP